MQLSKTLLHSTTSAPLVHLEKKLADLRAEAEEEGLDEEEGEPDIRLEQGVWRVRVLGMSAGGAGPEASTDAINNLLAYDGDLDTNGFRNCTAAKVAFPNRDTYFGGYEADAKAGVGLYVFANGGAYVGQYESGKRQGQGLMILPDGGLYRGAFVADKFEGQGTYLYPDNSYYTGSWKAGKKHGQGTYWDTAAGCLRGEWVAGALKGQGQYDQPNYHFEGSFAKGVPAGPCSFTMNAFRLAGLPQPAASYIIAPHGPTLCGEGQYAVPPGAADEPEAPTEDEEPAESDPDKPAMPAWPKYEGLMYESGAALPCSKPDMPFPPPAAAVAAI